jgi:hypothetical protein
LRTEYEAANVILADEKPFPLHEDADVLPAVALASESDQAA